MATARLSRQTERAPGTAWAQVLPAAALLALVGALAPGDASAQAAHPKPKPTVTARANPSDGASDRPVQSIVALVNDEPITGYEIEQRVALAMLGNQETQKRLQARLKSPSMNEQFKAFAMKRLQANPPKSQEEQMARVKQLQAEFVGSIKSQIEKDYVPTARKTALDELIDERLKLQEAKKLSVVAGDDEVERIVAGMAERNKMTTQQFGEHLAKLGANISVMRERVRASLSWSDVIRRKFGHMISVTNKDVDRMVANTEGADDVELRVHRLQLALPAAQDQKKLAQRLGEAESLRTKFDGCKSMEAMARGVSGVRFDNLGDRRPSSLPEPTRSLLLAAHDDELLPATIGEGGVELWAVCGRKVVKAADAKRETAQNELRQKEFEILSKKYLKDLRTDAHIEYR